MTSIPNLQNFKSLSINYLHSVVVENYANKCAGVWCAVLGLVCSVKPAGGIFPWIRSLSRELNTHPPSPVITFTAISFQNTQPYALTF